MAAPRPHPLLDAAGATHADGAWRVSAAALATAVAVTPALGERRCMVAHYTADTKRLAVLWASPASQSAWESEDLGVIGDKLSKIARDNVALTSIFSAAGQAAARGQPFFHVVATTAGSPLQRIRFTPLDVEDDGLERAPAEAEAGAGDGANAGAGPNAAAPRRRRCVLDELLPSDEPSPQHEQLLMRAQFADRYSSSLLTIISLQTREILHQNPASLVFHGYLHRNAAGGTAWLAQALLGGDAATLAAAMEEVQARRSVQLRARVTGQTTSAGDALSRWHDVALTPGIDPVTLEAVLVVTENDVSSLKAAEAELSRLHEAQLEELARSEAALEALVCSCFPEHVAAELLDNLMAAREVSASPRAQPQPTPPRLGVMARRRSGGKAVFGADAERAATAPASLPGGGCGRQKAGPESSPNATLPPLSAPSALGAIATRRASQPSSAVDDAAALLARVRAAGAQGRVAAQRHGCVSVVFTDIKGFTSMSSEADPLDVMSMLHELFVLFDALAERFGVFKLETVGDAYVAAVGDGIGAAGGGSPAACAAVAMQFAAACAAAAGSVLTPGLPGTPRSGAPVCIRVGVHSGAAMSGVVGTKMPRWALFGDTINLAARMESTGLPGRVQVSAAARALADAAGQLPPFAWHRRGEVDVKGKGVMATYLLRTAADADDCGDETAA